MLSFSTLYWISTIVNVLRGLFSGATRIITTEVFSPELQLRMIEQYKVTFTINAPFQLVLMLKNEMFRKEDCSSLKYLITGGSKLPFQLKNDVEKYLPNAKVSVVYGMSEIGQISSDFPYSNKKDSVGRLMDGYCMKIINDNGNRCGINEDGEICLKMNYKILGYFNNAEATKKAFDDEGFFLTGDIGHFDEDGELFFSDRKKDLLKYCGYQVSPSEIDAYLLTSNDIKSACVIGIPDSIATELLAAVIVRSEGSNVTEKDVFDMIAGNFTFQMFNFDPDYSNCLSISIKITSRINLNFVVAYILWILCRQHLRAKFCDD